MQSQFIACTKHFQYAEQLRLLLCSLRHLHLFPSSSCHMPAKTLNAAAQSTSRHCETDLMKAILEKTQFLYFAFQMGMLWMACPYVMASCINVKGWTGGCDVQRTLQLLGFCGEGSLPEQGARCAAAACFVPAKHTYLSRSCRRPV